MARGTFWSAAPGENKDLTNKKSATSPVLNLTNTFIVGFHQELQEVVFHLFVSLEEMHH